MKEAVGASGIDHNETIILGTPALIRERDKPMIPSPVIRPLPVSQALKTTNSAFNFISRICSAVSKPLTSSTPPPPPSTGGEEVRGWGIEEGVVGGNGLA